MNRNDALKAMIDGKRVKPRHPGYVLGTPIDYLYFDGCQFRVVYKDGNNIACPVIGEDVWEIVPDYVDFAEAYKQYKNGRAIQPCTGELYQKDSNYYDNLCVREKEIDGKWVISEDG